MDMVSEIKQLKDEERTHNSNASFCCLPINKSGAAFCGILFLMIGVVWLLNVLGVFISGIGVLWPLLFICLGLLWLARSRSGQS